MEITDFLPRRTSRRASKVSSTPFPRNASRVRQGWLLDRHRDTGIDRNDGWPFRTISRTSKFCFQDHGNDES